LELKFVAELAKQFEIDQMSVGRNSITKLGKFADSGYHNDRNSSSNRFLFKQ
jgi:hypothetical protein